MFRAAHKHEDLQTYESLEDTAITNSKSICYKLFPLIQMKYVLFVVKFSVVRMSIHHDWY
ncbi:hypothetical protein C0J52_00294 [Blattella germanica]|nr:hypothetical protein C0J52_00294 [Blattella germanica]